VVPDEGSGAAAVRAPLTVPITPDIQVERREP